MGEVATEFLRASRCLLLQRIMPQISPRSLDCPVQSPSCPDSVDQLRSVFPVRAGARAGDKFVEIAIVTTTYAISVAERGDSAR
jgi:hypothetical protein